MRRPNLGAVDEIDEGVAPGLGMVREPSGDRGQGRRRVAGLLGQTAGAQPRVDEIGRYLVKGRIVRVVAETDRDVAVLKELEERLVGEARVAWLDGVAHPPGQKVEEGGEVGLVELLGRGELPQDRAEFRAELRHPAGEKLVER